MRVVLVALHRMLQLCPNFPSPDFLTHSNVAHVRSSQYIGSQLQYSVCLLAESHRAARSAVGKGPQQQHREEQRERAADVATASQSPEPSSNTNRNNNATAAIASISPPMQDLPPASQHTPTSSSPAPHPSRGNAAVKSLVTSHNGAVTSALAGTKRAFEGQTAIDSAQCLDNSEATVTKTTNKIANSNHDERSRRMASSNADSIAPLAGDDSPLEGDDDCEEAEAVADSTSGGDASDDDDSSDHPEARERRDSGVGSSLTRAPSDRRRHRIRWHSFVKSHRPSLNSENLQVARMSAGQLMVLRKLCLLKVTSLMEKYSPSNRSGWNWFVASPHSLTQVLSL